MLPARFIFIADIDDLGRKLFPVLNAVLGGGCRWVLLRGLKKSAGSLRMALKVKLLCKKSGAALFISREKNIATRIKADGLHLSAMDDARNHKTKNLLIGQSCHNEKELLSAARAGVDYVFLSPVFPTPSKPGYGPALGIRKLKALTAKTTLPVVALGGITPANATLCLKAGAAAVAVMGGLSNARQPKNKTRLYLSRTASS